MIKRESHLSHEGFTLLELIAVIAGLGILSSLAIPNFIKYLQFAQIDEAKSILNAAASECLQELRRSTDDSWKDFEPEALKARKSSTEGGLPALPGNYQYQDGNNTCEEIQIYDPAGGDTIFPMLRFRIDASGRVFKDSQYFNDESKKDCETWGNCGGSESADYLIKCKADQTACGKENATRISNQRDGVPLQIEQWQGTCKWPKDDSALCQKITILTCEGKRLPGKDLTEMAENLEKCKKKQFNAACNAKREEQLASLGNPKNGILDIPDCGIYERYYKGNPLDCGDRESCETAYIVEAERELQEICEEKYHEFKKRGVDGKFEEPGCVAKWRCGDTYYNDQQSYDLDKACKPTDPPVKVCKIPPSAPVWCPYRPDRRECQPVCS